VRYPEILSIEPEPAEFAYDDHYTRLYALGLGAGAEPQDLPFIYEKALRALPTMAVMMAAASGEFLTRGEIDYRMIVRANSG
jgi:hypothetical protein